MNIRETSIEAYHANQVLLSRRRKQVFNALWGIGAPATGGEIFKAMQRLYGMDVPTNSNTTTRLGELREMGVVAEIGTRRCTVSNQNVNLWEVTGRIGNKIKKPEKRRPCPHCNGSGHAPDLWTYSL